MSSGGGHGGGELEFPGLHALHELLESSNLRGGFIVPGWLLLILYCVAAGFFAVKAPLQSALNWNLLLVLGPLWLPIVIGRFALMRFLNMRQFQFNSKNPLILLEIKIPRDIRKTPQAMETFFSHMHINPGEGTWMKKYWWGRTRPWWSFEIASFEGAIHFYIGTRRDMRRLIESALYAQYPEVELIEATDYSRLRNPAHEPFRMFACEYMHGKPDPYPIRTYVDYGIDKPGAKPEETTDPFTQVLELFGSLGSEEQLWTQLIVRVSKGEKWRGKKGPSGKPFNWRDEAAALVAKLREEAIFKTTVPAGDSGVTQILENPTDVMRELIKAIERNVGKPAFDVGMRSIYSAPVDKYRTMNPFVANVFKPFSSPLGNTIEPAPLWSEKFNDYPWEDIGGHRMAAEMHEALEAYRARAYYYAPYRGPWMVMSSEELASIYHIPSATAKTPGLGRIPSTTSSAPANLPQ